MSATTLLRSIQPKKLWSDVMEEDELFQKEKLTLEEFAKCIYHLMHKCDLDLDSKTTKFFYKIKDTYVDFLVRNYMVICLSKDKETNKDTFHSSSEEETEEETEEDLPVETQETRDEFTEQPKLEQIEQLELETVKPTVKPRSSSFIRNKPPKTTEPTTEHPVVTNNKFTLLDEDHEVETITEPPFQSIAMTTKTTITTTPPRVEQIEEKSTWDTVVSKKQKKTQQACELVENENNPYVFFKDEANSAYIDYVGTFQNLNDVCEEAKKYKWSHAYCIPRNMVYDFSDRKHPGHYRHFIPNTAYLTKFQNWQKKHEETAGLDTDSREFFVFKEKSTWNTWEFLGTIIGLSVVREFVKENNYQWSHAYNPENNDLFDFMQEDYLVQKRRKAPQKYLTRFAEFIEKKQ